MDVEDTVVARGGSRRVRVARAAWRESSGVVHDTLSGRRRGAGAIHRSILKDSVDPPPP